MVGITSLEVYKTILDITEENNKFKPYNFLDRKNDGVSYEKVRDDIEINLGVSHITPTDLQGEILAPIIIEDYREQVTKRMEDDAYMKFLASYIRSMFQDFESYLRTEADLVGDDIRLILIISVQIQSLMNYNQVVTLLRIFPKLF